MAKMTSSFVRRGGVVLLGALGLAGWSISASGQSLIDPYQPDSAPYYTSSFPSLPNNLALPGQAREAGEYQRNVGVSRYNTYDRYINDQDNRVDPISQRGRSVGGIGVPYYDAVRQNDGTFQRDFKPTRDADRNLLAYEAERTRRYTAAMKEKDPVKRAKLLKEVSRMQMPKQTPGRTTEPRSPELPKAAAAPPLSADEALAAEALSGMKSVIPEAGSAGTGLRVRAPSPSIHDTRSANVRRLREKNAASDRPPLPSETLERNSRRPPR